MGGVVILSDPNQWGGGLQIMRMFEGRIDAGILAYTDLGMNGPGLGLGGLLRFPVLENSWSTLGLSLSAGPIWGQAGLPMSVAINDGLWLYSEPTISQTHDATLLKIPIGLAYERSSGRRSSHDLRIYHEVGAWLAPWETGIDRLYYSVGIGYPR